MFEDETEEVETEGSEENEEETPETTEETEEESKPKLDKDGNVDIDAIVAEKVAAAVKDIKGKLDNAYKSRDELADKVKSFETEKREAELAQLKEEGKHQEAFDLKVQEMQETIDNLTNINIGLTRDNSLRESLSNLNFRNSTASELAFKTIVDQLVTNEEGDWVHKSNVSIPDYVKLFAEHEENSFMFKAKTSTGAGSSKSGKSNSNNSSGKKSLFEMSQDEVLQQAREGKL